jgi:hypothetical protein
MLGYEKRTFASNGSGTEDAPNDNASSISSWNNGRLDAIASPFGLVIAFRRSPEGRDREASLRTASTREHQQTNSDRKRRPKILQTA